MPETLEKRVLSAFAGCGSLFRKTSCAVSFTHGVPDYNGHYGIRELCDICPARTKSDLCKSTHRVPSGLRGLPGSPQRLPEAERHTWS